MKETDESQKDPVDCFVEGGRQPISMTFVENDTGNSVKLGRQPVSMAPQASVIETRGRQPVDMTPLPIDPPSNSPRPSTTPANSQPSEQQTKK